MDGAANGYAGGRPPGPDALPPRADSGPSGVATTHPSHSLGALPGPLRFRAALRNPPPRPQLGTQPAFEPGDGRQVGPGAPCEHLSDDRVIDTRERLNGPRASPVHSHSQVQSKPPSCFHSDVVDGHSWPSRRQLTRLLAARSGHASSLGETSDKPPPSTIEAGDPHTAGVSNPRTSAVRMAAVKQFTPKVPAEHWARVEPFVRAAALEAAPAVPYTMNRLTTDLSHFVIWAWQTACLPLERSVLLHRDVIESYAVHGCPELSRTSAGNRRSLLLRVAEVLLPPQERVKRLTPLCDPNPSAPYSREEVTHLRAWARGQITETRQRDCATLLALGLGAGLNAAEIKALRVGDLHVDAEGVLINVAGARPRTVPVLATWESSLADLIHASASDKLAFAPGRTKTTSRNSVTNFVGRTAGIGLKPNSHRMRATWIVHHLSCGTPLLPLMEAAGLMTLEVLDRYMTYVEGVRDIRQARVLLRRKLDISPGIASP